MFLCPPKLDDRRVWTLIHFGNTFVHAAYILLLHRPLHAWSGVSIPGTQLPFVPVVPTACIFLAPMLISPPIHSTWQDMNLVLNRSISVQSSNGRNSRSVSPVCSDRFRFQPLLSTGSVLGLKGDDDPKGTGRTWQDSSGRHRGHTSHQSACVPPAASPPSR